MQTAFGSHFDKHPIEQAERQLLEAVRAAVAELSIKEVSYRLDVSASLLADALAERSSKGIRASWLVTIIDMASEARAVEIVSALLHRKALEVVERKVLTPEQRAERLEEKLRSLGPVGLQLIREVDGRR